jgi:surface polysaccharide O-acyltransferase-like enzyme
MSIYPVIYYFIGAYIAKYAPKINKGLCAAIVLVLVALQTVILILAQPYLQTNWLLTEYGSIFIIIESVCIFLIFYDLDVKNKPIQKLLAYISSVTLEFYLLSYIVDSHVYPFIYNLNDTITQEQFFKKYFLIIIPVLFLAGLTLSAVFHVIYDNIGKLLTRLSGKSKKASKEIHRVR